MLDIISDGFKRASEKFRGKSTLSEENLTEALQEIRRSLLDGDVEYSVAKNFLARVKEKSLGEVVSLKAGSGTDKIRVSPGDHFVKICKEELENLMGPVEVSLKLANNRVSIIMMVGLQGTGKTTTTAKLASYLKQKKKRKPLLVAADIYRPAAVSQLEVLGQRIGVPVFHLKETSPVQICIAAKAKALELDCDTVIFDTAGRLTIDEELMQELISIKNETKPDNILLVCDAMMGQDAVTTSKAFDDQLDLTGFIMTKLDGDARGGAALSIKEVTGKPIKFLGMGEELDKLEEFRPEGLASRILGMGDIVGLMDDFERVADGDKEVDTMRMLQGQFNFTDFYEQIATIQKMGSLKDVIAKLPMQNMIPKDANIDDRELGKIKAMIDSMTKKERLNPDLINASRIKRIAGGSGRSTRDVTELINKFKSMRKIMGSMGKNLGGMLGKIPGMNALSKLNDMRKMATSGGFPGMGGMGSMADMFSGFGGMGGMGGEEPAQAHKRVDRDKILKARKLAKQNRKKNRK